jgi:hypothetical protein
MQQLILEPLQVVMKQYVTEAIQAILLYLPRRQVVQEPSLTNGIHKPA